MTKLSVNLNKIALLRNSRTIGIPDVIKAARTCMAAGAHGITIHPRPDERHIRITDVYELAEMLKPTSDIEINIEGNPFVHAQSDERSRWFELVQKIAPDQCTLVPDSPDAFTSDHGWDLRDASERLRPVVQDLQNKGIRVSLFLDPDVEQVELAAALGVDRIELYTEAYAAHYGTSGMSSMLEAYARAAARAQEIGLGVNAGHDLNLQNLGTFCTIPGILEVSIGHALVADALDMGLYAAVQAYLKVLQGAKPSILPPPSR